MTVNYERAVSRRYLTVRVIAISRLRISARVTPPEDVTRFLPTTSVCHIGWRRCITYVCVREFIANEGKRERREEGIRGRRERKAQGIGQGIVKECVGIVNTERGIEIGVACLHRFSPCATVTLVTSNGGGTKAGVEETLRVKRAIIMIVGSHRLRRIAQPSRSNALSSSRSNARS